MKLTRKVIATVALVALPVVGALGAQPASAEDNGPAGVPGKSCAIEVDGVVKQVPVGSRVGLFYCGRDGDWHVGWLVDEIVQPKPPKKPPVVTRAQTSVFTAVR